MKVFVREVAASFGVGYRYRSKGGVTLISPSFVNTLITLDECEDPFSFLLGIDEMDWAGSTSEFDSGSRLMDGLRNASNNVFYNKRPGVPNILIFISGSLQSNVDNILFLQYFSDEMRRKNIQMFTVNVEVDANFHAQQKYNESFAERVFMAPTPIHLENVTFIDILVKAACNSVQGGKIFLLYEIPK